MTEPTPGPDAPRDPLEILADEFLERLRRGETPSVEEYATAHPELADEIRDLFPTVSAIERLKAQGERSSDGRASLGPVRIERLGDFRIVREIGRGGMGIVYEAEQESLGRRVAIKVLPRQMLLEPNDLARFEREARIAAGLHHTNIVQIYGVGEQDGFHYYVMQLVRGAALDRVIDRVREIAEGRRPAPKLDSVDTEDRLAAKLLGSSATPGPDYFRAVARIGRQAASAIDYGHAQGTLHRDVKPANLLLDEDGVAWVTDFGLARSERAGAVTQSGDVAGTLRYMPPERFEGKVDARSDVYALGLTLYEMLTLRAAYDETDRSTLIKRITHEPVGRLSATEARIPRDLETVVLKAVAHEPARRYASAGDLAADIERFLDDQPVLARRAGAAERLWRWCRRNRAVAALSAASVLLLVAVAVTATVGYVREARQRARAEALAGLAREAIDRVFDRLGPAHPVSSTSLTLSDDCSTQVEIVHPSVVSKESAALLEEMLPFYDRLAQQAGSTPALRARAADAERRLGDIRQRLGQYAPAATAYLGAVDAYRDLASGDKDSKFTVLAASTLNELGRTYRLVSKSAEADDAHRKALDLLGATDTSLPASAAARFEVATACYYLGCRPGPDPVRKPPPGPGPRLGPPPLPGDGPPVLPRRDSRRRYIDRAVALLDTLTRGEPANPTYQHLLALCYREQAFGPPESSDRSALDHAARILESLVEKYPDEPQYLFDLSETCATRLPPAPGPDREPVSTAEKRVSRALELSQQLLAKHPGVPEYLAGQARVYFELSDAFRRERRPDETEQTARKAVEVQSGLVREFVDVVPYRVMLAVFRNSLTELLLARGKTKEAQTLAEATVADGNRLLLEHPDLWYVHAMLADANRSLAMILRRDSQPAKADQTDREAERHLQALGAGRRLHDGP